MSRLATNHPLPAISEEQKKALAEIDSEFEARIAERRIFLEGEISKAAGDELVIGELRRQLAGEMTVLEEKRELKKDKIRFGSPPSEKSL